jgi:hypothetical protein
VTRRRPLTLARQSRLVEIGPVTALRANTFDTLLPFPHLRSGWGLDLHWSALARERGWREGVIDATAIGHDLRKIAAAYDSDSAVAEARDFLSGRPYLSAIEAQQIVATYRQL